MGRLWEYTIDDAIVLNESIDPDNAIEGYMQTVYGIYLNTVASGIDLSSSDSTTLEEIAYMNWIEAGDAIYMAAAMLGLEIHPVLESLRLAASPLANNLNNLQNVNHTVSIIPNPATTSLYLSGMDNQTASVTIYDMHGMKIFDKQITGNSVINITTFVNGIYRMNINLSNGEISRLKFAIMRP